MITRTTGARCGGFRGGAGVNPGRAGGFVGPSLRLWMRLCTVYELTVDTIPFLRSLNNEDFPWHVHLRRRRNVNPPA